MTGIPLVNVYFRVSLTLKMGKLILRKRFVHERLSYFNELTYFKRLILVRALR